LKRAVRLLFIAGAVAVIGGNLWIVLAGAWPRLRERRGRADE
jgi:hypothetical protein